MRGSPERDISSPGATARRRRILGVGWDAGGGETRGVGMRARHTYIRQGNKHPTSRQKSYESTGILASLQKSKEFKEIQRIHRNPVNSQNSDEFTEIQRFKSYTEIRRIHRNPQNSQNSNEFTDILRVTEIQGIHRNPKNSQKYKEFAEISRIHRNLNNSHKSEEFTGIRRTHKKQWGIQKNNYKQQHIKNKADNKRR